MNGSGFFVEFLTFEISSAVNTISTEPPQLTRHTHSLETSHIDPSLLPTCLHFTSSCNNECRLSFWGSQSKRRREKVPYGPQERGDGMWLRYKARGNYMVEGKGKKKRPRGDHTVLLHLNFSVSFCFLWILTIFLTRYSRKKVQGRMVRFWKCIHHTVLRCVCVGGVTHGLWLQLILLSLYLPFSLPRSDRAVSVASSTVLSLQLLRH